MEGNIKINGEISEKISVNIVFLGIFIICIFACNDIYLGITEYYYFPILSIIFSISYFLKEPINRKLEHWCGIFIICLIFIGFLR